MYFLNLLVICCIGKATVIYNIYAGSIIFFVVNVNSFALAYAETMASEVFLSQSELSPKIQLSNIDKISVKSFTLISADFMGLKLSNLKCTAMLP
jgi:hypothetical protein